MYRIIIIINRLAFTDWWPSSLKFGNENNNLHFGDSMFYDNHDDEFISDGINNSDKLYPCKDCGKVYRVQRSLWRHTNFECNQEPRFSCTYCPYRSKQKVVLINHLKRKHKEYYSLLKL